MINRNSYTLLVAILLAMSAYSAEPGRSASVSAANPDPDDSLLASFRSPPPAARPRVWWHWMNGNITRDGIAKDLDWLARVGIGGVQNFDANLMTPQIVDERLVYMSPQWQDAFRFAASEAHRLGLELAIAASPGWSETGGPWVPPEDGLKKLVWSEIELPGGQPFKGKLPELPSQTGPFQTIAKPPAGLAAILESEKKAELPAYHADVKVLAVPIPAGEAPQPAVVTTTTGQGIDPTALVDGDYSSELQVEKGTAENPATLTFTYPEDRSVRTATLFMPGASAMFVGATVAPRLEASTDGKAWRQIADMPVMGVPTTVSFAPVTARYFRLVIEPRTAGMASLFAPAPGLAMDLGASMGGMLGGDTVRVADFRLLDEPRIDRYEAKAGFEIEPDYYHLDNAMLNGEGVDPGAVLDITDRMRPDGSLDWTPPTGNWRVLRLGWSLLGTTNHPATPEATGLEVDKFDGSAVRRYLEHYLGLYAQTLGKPLKEQDLLNAILTDSIEVGAANWTPAMMAKFTERRGYDPTPWLPALTGTIIGSREQSERFLYDYRRTLADLIATEHYGTVAAVAHENGLRVYGEALESGRPSLGDDMAMRRYADVPMSAMWTHTRERGPQPSHVADMRGAASVAHIYGQNFVAAESLTSALEPWAHAPAQLKRIIDLEFVNGVNLPVIHTSVHQPVDDKVPGLALFIFGQYFNRHETWAEMARSWIDYIARNSFMLQQGRNVADLGYFYGEEGPLTGLYRDRVVADVPGTYAWDFVNADAVLTALANDGGDLVSPGGARYRALYLGGSSSRMTLATLQRLAALVEGGATIIGKPPLGSPSLQDDPDAFQRLLARLWSGQQLTRLGSGRVYAMDDAEAALALAGVRPDFRFTGGDEASSIPFVHRQLVDGDGYFLVNQRDRAETIEAHFRVSGKVPELWRAETGTTEPASFRIEGGETIVPLTLAADESIHIVFREPTDERRRLVTPRQAKPVATIDSSWRVSFQSGHGAPAQIDMPSLKPLNEMAEAGVRYFSGIATYSTEFLAPGNWRAGEPLLLDLGAVGELAEVAVNGIEVGTVWHPPFRLDVGPATRPGTNQLEVRVANLWVNRLIGDAQPGATKITWTALPRYRADAPLRPSGLIGPVGLLTVD